MKLLVVVYRVQIFKFKKIVKEIVEEALPKVVFPKFLSKEAIKTFNNSSRICYNISGTCDLLAKSDHLFKLIHYISSLPRLKNKIVEPDTLPVFIVPEFFFLKYDQKPYTKKEFYLITDYWEKISKEKCYSKWLLILGSIYWRERISVSKKETFVVHNTACIINNGKLVHTYLKQLPSLKSADPSLDASHFWDGDAGFDNSNEIVETLKKRGQLLKEYSDVRRKMKTTIKRSQGYDLALDSNVFIYKNIKFGIEICLDHNLQILKRQIDDNPSLLPDIHILIGCGIHKDKNNIVTKSNGVFIRCDGGGRSPFIEVHRIKLENETKKLLNYKQREANIFMQKIQIPTIVNDLLFKKIKSEKSYYPDLEFYEFTI